LPEPFSLLEKNEKTFEHVKEYFEALEKGIDLFAIDNIIQKRELILHLERHCKESDQQECLNWINENAAKFRNYLNSLRVITLLIFADCLANHRKGLVWEIFCKFIDVWDEQKSKIMDSIRLEK